MNKWDHGLLWLVLFCTFVFGLAGCSSVPRFKTNRCYFKAQWEYPKFARKKIVKHKIAWEIRGFAISAWTIDLAKKQENGFSCKNVQTMQVRLYQTSSDFFWNLLPFYHSSHIEVIYTPR